MLQILNKMLENTTNCRLSGPDRRARFARPDQSVEPFLHRLGLLRGPAAHRQREGGEALRGHLLLALLEDCNPLNKMLEILKKMLEKVTNS